MLNRLGALGTLLLLAIGAGCATRGDTASERAAAAPAAAQRWGIVIHGGAGTIRRSEMTPAMDAAYRAGLERAVRAGHAVLARGGTSLDAVEAAIRVMEDDSLFNAGRGAVFTAAGTNELDAAIMDGSDLSAGAVAGLTRIRNPISLARLVMEKSAHVFMAREGAEAFAREQGVQFVDPSYFRTERRWRALERARAADTTRTSGDALLEAQDRKFGTVGAVALDQHGNLAAGTSTGGMTNKRYGRIGDVPVIGAGTYASNRSCAVSATGHGEFFIRYTVAHDICARMQYLGVPLAQAAEDVVMKALVAAGGEGGIIAMDPRGTIHWEFNSEGMYRASMDAAGRVVVEIYQDE